MCLNSLQKRYDSWISLKPVHPIWLEHKEKGVQDSYDKIIRLYV